MIALKNSADELKPLIAGLDLSLRSTGVCIGRPGSWETHALKNTLKGPARLAWIRDQINILVACKKPDLVAIEGYAYGANGRKFDIGELGGVVGLMLYDMKVPVIGVQPTQLKQFVTGNGGAKKHHMMKAVLQKYGVATDCDDVADAVGLAMCAYVTMTGDSDYRSELEVVKKLRDKKKKRSIKFQAPKSV